MKEHEILLLNIDKIHTTGMGIKRLEKNLSINNVVEYCKEKITNSKSKITKKGKNYYCIIDNVIITINSNSYTIITAHKIKD